MAYPRRSALSQIVYRPLRLIVAVAVLAGCLSALAAIKSAARVTNLPSAARQSKDAPARLSTAGQQDTEAQKIDKVLRRYETLKLDARQTAQGVRNGGKLTLVIANATLELELEPNDLRAANYRAEESGEGGDMRALDTAMPVRTFKGIVRGKEHSTARFTIDDTTIEGLIFIDGEKYFVEKKQKYAQSAAPTEFLFYRESDVIETSPASCDASVGEKMKQVGEVVSSQDSGSSWEAQEAAGTIPLDREIELATEADYEYVSALGGSESANDEILSILNLIEGVYQNELGISFSVVYQHTWATTDDPYRSAAPATALAEFKNYWNANFTNVSRDAAHLWTGKNLDGDVIGSAEIGVVCLVPSRAYGLSQLLSETDIKVGITAHELGHNLGATHSDQDPAATNCGNTIMQSQVGYARSFCPYSRQQIASYVSSNASCLAPTFSITGSIASESYLGDLVLSLTGPKTKTYPINVFGGTSGFTLRGLPAGTYTLTASGRFQVFTPASRTITITDSNVAGADFTSALVRFKVGGRLVDANNVGIGGVAVSISTPSAFISQTTSDANGNYEFEVPATRDYRITPYSPEGHFTPIDATISILTEDRLNLNFVGTMRPKPTPTPSPTPTPTPIAGLSGAIAFESNWHGQSNLHVIEADGSNEAVLVNNVFHDASPRWSPDGASLAFVKDGGIYLANADGSNLRKLTTAQVLEGSPNWSSDGKRIMYSTGVNLIVSDTNGAVQTQLRLDTFGFSWSPDGSKIAYVTGSLAGSQLHVMNVDGTGQATLTSGAWTFTEPEWSPDGTKLVFVRGEVMSTTSQIMVMNADGGGQTSLTSMAGGTMTPTWSPDGTKIAFSRAGVIYAMNADGSNETRITNNGRYNTHAAWKAGATSRPAPTPTPTPTPTPPSMPPILSLNVGATGTYTVGEGDGRLVIKVLRAGDLSSPVSVGFKTNDSDGSAPCSYLSGTAYERCDYATTVETLRFAAGETEKTVAIPIIDDAYVEGQELMHVQLFAPMGGGMGAANHAFVSIVDNDTSLSPNPALSIPFFVRQHYLDFLSREPEANEPWSAVLNNCPNAFNFDATNPSAACDRIIVSQSFFGSPEFRLKGFYAFNFYRVAFNRRPTYEEIIPDMRSMTGATTEEVYQKRAAFPVSFVSRAEFAGLYDALSDTAFVNTLMDRYALQQITTPDPANPEGGTKLTLTRSALATRLGATGAQALTRAQVLRAIVESNEIGAAEYNHAFVAMQYYGYLRRTPEESGYQAWLRVINQDPNNIRIMVNGFLNSTEYRLRFGQP
jgi:Tol biopolymer transport system component